MNSLFIADEYAPRGQTKSRGLTSGGLSAVAPPVPIPNTEVKRRSPDGSASLGCARVGRCQYCEPRLINLNRGSFRYVASAGGADYRVGIAGLLRREDRAEFTTVKSSPG